MPGREPHERRRVAIAFAVLVGIGTCFLAAEVMVPALLGGLSGWLGIAAAVVAVGLGLAGLAIAHRERRPFIPHQLRDGTDVPGRP
jgi:hypothetical protein